MVKLLDYDLEIIDLFSKNNFFNKITYNKLFSKVSYDKNLVD